MAAPVKLRSDTVRGLALTLVGVLLLVLGANVSIPTGGGPPALLAGFAILGGFACILLGVILYLLGTRV